MDYLTESAEPEGNSKEVINHCYSPSVCFNGLTGDCCRRRSTCAYHIKWPFGVFDVLYQRDSPHLHIWTALIFFRFVDHVLLYFCSSHSTVHFSVNSPSGFIVPLEASSALDKDTSIRTLSPHLQHTVSDLCDVLQWCQVRYKLILKFIPNQCEEP